MSLELTMPIERYSRIAKNYIPKLKKLNIYTLKDLIYYFPFRFDDFSNIILIKELINNFQTNTDNNAFSTIKGCVLKIDLIKTRKRNFSIIKAHIKDESGVIAVNWFNQPYIIKTLRIGTQAFFSGKVCINRNEIILNNPIVETIKKRQIHTGRLVPIYHETLGLTSRWIRYIINDLLPKIIEQEKECLPKSIIKQLNLLKTKEALINMHFPKKKADYLKAKKRFDFQNIFISQLRFIDLKRKRGLKKGYKINFKEEETKKLISYLKFNLTKDQKIAIWEMLKNMETGNKKGSMNRLLEGDVGAGKTIVAAILCLNVILNKFQSVLIAPTEILVEQHFEKLKEFYKNQNINIYFLTKNANRIYKPITNEETNLKKEEIKKRIRKGETGLFIGTHALLQKDIDFKKLGLIVIDEQHRFGIAQRAKLLKKSKIRPHFLTMTATPIPRTLALTIYGDLEISRLKEKPGNRKEIITKVIKDNERKEIYSFVKNQIKSGRQAFVICPLIEKKNQEEELTEKDYLKLDLKAVEEEYNTLKDNIFTDIAIAKLHGKMKPEEKEKIMKRFLKGDIKILVSTSVVEVGVDVPNATIMIIESSDRFGLAQIHQFRGRVGRNNMQSYCFLLTNSKKEEVYNRLKVLTRVSDGFKLAEEDLKIRGPGQFSGNKQSGQADKMMSSLTNYDLVKKARSWAERTLEVSPYLNEFPILKKRLEDFNKNVHLE